VERRPLEWLDANPSIEYAAVVSQAQPGRGQPKTGTRSASSPRAIRS